jgi:uncharacterized protein (DUF2384 family)
MLLPLYFQQGKESSQKCFTILQTPLKCLRTISNYKEQQKPLEPAQSEHLLKLIALFGKGEEIFGNVNEFNYWLQKSFWNAKERPIDWLITPGGVDLIMDELDRLAHAYAV